MANLATKPAFPDKIQRFNSHQMSQHIILFLSMFVLILTGFAIKWADMGWAQWVLSMFGSFETMFKAHLGAGIVMLLAGAYHIVWMVLNFMVSGPKWSMVPNLNDAKCVYQHAMYLLRFRKEPPNYGRYTYLEKFEYLAGGYGIILMGATGALLWYPEVAAEWMPRWVIHLLRIGHSNEAVVCTMAVFLGHFFWVHFHPDVVPSSSVWYNGKISTHHLKEEHILEYQELVEQCAPPADHGHAEKPIASSRFYIGLLFVIYAALIVWLFSLVIPVFLS